MEITVDTARKVSEEATYTPKSTDSGRFLKVSVSYTDRHGMKTLTSADAEATRAVRAATANQAPKFSEGASTFRIIMENAKPNAEVDDTQGNVGVPITATDVNGDALAYTLSGADAALFKVTRIADDVGQPQIEVKSGTELNYETKNRYSVTLTANDGSDTSNATASITVTIYITDVDEKPTTSGPQTVNYAENRTNPVATFTARDPERATPINWSLAADTFTLDLNDNDDFTDPGDVAATDSVDGSRFKITSEGVLSFVTPPNYEAPVGGGTGGDSNTYKIVVQASDGDKVDRFKVIVTVTDINEPGKVTWTVGPGGSQLSPARSLLQFRSGAQLVATVTDGDGEVAADTTWKWWRGSSQITGAPTTGEYTVADADVGHRIRAEASYREKADRPIKSVSFTSEKPVLAIRMATNNVPAFVSANVSRGIAENAAVGASVGGPITASDADGDTLTYSIPADTPNFAINATTGRLTVKADAMLDHDTTPSQTVMVTVTDPSGGTASTTVTINITDVNEAPEFADAESDPPLNPSVAAIAENSTRV